MKRKIYISKEEMWLDDMFIGPQERHNFLFAEEHHVLTNEDLEFLKDGNCIGLNVDNEFICFIYKEED